MNKNAGQRRKIETEETIEPVIDEDLVYDVDTGNDESFIDPSFMEKMNEFIARSNIDVGNITFYLYKYENRFSGAAKSILKKYANGDQPPDEDEIGRQFGSGRYLVMMTVPAPPGGKSKVRAYNFKLHEHYDTIRNNAPVSAAAQSSGTGDFIQMFTMMQGMMHTMMQTIIPLIRQEKPPENPDFAKLMAQNYQMVNEITKKQMLDNVDLMGDFQRKIAMMSKRGGQAAIDDFSDTEQDDDEEQGSGVFAIIEQLKPFLDDWLPKLIGSGQQSKAVTSIVKSTSMFKEIAKNRSMINALIAHLDSTAGGGKKKKGI